MAGSRLLIGPQEGKVPVEDEQGIEIPPPVASDLHHMSGPQLFPLPEHPYLQKVPKVFLDPFSAGPHQDRSLSAAASEDASKQMPQHRHVQDRMQHFGELAPHPRALSRSHNENAQARFHPASPPHNPAAKNKGVSPHIPFP